MRNTIAHQFYQARDLDGRLRLAASVLANQSQAASLSPRRIRKTQVAFKHLELITRAAQVLMVLVLGG